ncbi:hypothetical protein IAD21_02093 [Abditibacteriota bacterium]|nr:hypothetical protein IAD21_02093 [Abditibacteriota bacterium]
MTTLSSSEILEQICDQLDEMREFYGPHFEGVESHWCVADARLSAFAFGPMWMIVFEIIGYCPGADEFENRLWCYGNFLQERADFCDQSLPVLSFPFVWNTQFEKGIWGAKWNRFSVRIEGERHDFAPTLEDWQRHDILLSRREIESGQIPPETMLRFVCDELNHPFFASDDVLRAFLDEKALPFSFEYDEPNDRVFYRCDLGDCDEIPIPSLVLKKLVQTRHWLHPRLGLADVEEGEWEISPHNAFQELSEVLVSGKPTQWNQRRWNSDWRLYAESAGIQEQTQHEFNTLQRANLRGYIEKFSREAACDIVRGLREVVEESLIEGQAIAVNFPTTSFSSIVFAEQNGEDKLSLTLTADLLDALREAETSLLE